MDQPAENKLWSDELNAFDFVTTSELLPAFPVQRIAKLRNSLETRYTQSIQFAGSLGTQVVKFFDVVAARAGLRDHEARSAGFDPFTSEVTVWDHKVYYMSKPGSASS